MIQYVSNKGGGSPVDFETAILDGFAVDGGLYVPTQLPKITLQQLKQWQSLSYTELAFEVLSFFIDPSIVSADALRDILSSAHASFEHEEVVPLHPLTSRKNTYIMELFHGPTLSFKDVGLSFLVGLVNFFLERKNERLSLIVATTGDTGPATAYFTAGKSNLDAWVLYPKDKITPEQERQMTCLPHTNIHPVGVSNCPEGGDDLDAVITQLYNNESFKEKLHLSSVNSINWGRVMIQTVHYIYGYLQVVDDIGEPVSFSVPSGGFGNLCAGAIVREMGLPINKLVAANNSNDCLHRLFSQGILSKAALVSTASSAIDILTPFNFWRFLYFCVDQDTVKIKTWMDEFNEFGRVAFDEKTYHQFSQNFLSYSATDEQTLDVITQLYKNEGYLVDPHAAVSIYASDALKESLGDDKLICLATAHPAKFPQVMLSALNADVLPSGAMHHQIEMQKTMCEKVHLCDHSHLEQALMQAMESHWELTHNEG